MQVRQAHGGGAREVAAQLERNLASLGDECGKVGDAETGKEADVALAGQTPYPPFDRCPPNRVKLTAVGRAEELRKVCTENLFQFDGVGIQSRSVLESQG